MKCDRHRTPYTARTDRREGWSSDVDVHIFLSPLFFLSNNNSLDNMYQKLKDIHMPDLNSSRLTMTLHPWGQIDCFTKKAKPWHLTTNDTTHSIARVNTNSRKNSGKQRRFLTKISNFLHKRDGQSSNFWSMLVSCNIYWFPFWPLNIY